MPPHYFKPDTLINTLCEHCGAAHQYTLERLYSDLRLICPCCGQEHTVERKHFRQNVDEAEALVDSLTAWTDKLAIRLRRWLDSGVGGRSGHP